MFGVSVLRAKHLKSWEATADDPVVQAPGLTRLKSLLEGRQHVLGVVAVWEVRFVKCC